MHAVLHELRQGFRQLIRYPRFTALVALTLALGIGASTTVFSVVNAVLLQPLPYAESDRLAWLLEIPTVLAASTGVQVPDRGQTTIDDTSPYAEIVGRSIPRAERQRVSTLTIQPGYFRALGIPLIGGRGFSDDDRADRPRVAIVNESLARAYLAGEDPVGQRLTLDSWVLPGAQPGRIPWPS